MSKEITMMLDEEISEAKNELSNAVTNEEKKYISEKIVSLVRMKVESIKSDREIADKLIRYGIDIAAIVLPLIFYGVWMNKGFEFEKTGAISSGVFKGLTRHFRPTK